MLERVLRHLRNWFIVPGECYTCTYTIEGGAIDLPLKVGQYFLLTGSVFNDGIHKYGDGGLTDEVFHGTIYGLSVPKALLDVVADIEAWQEKNGAVAAGPYQSESFGGYSYTLKNGSDSGSVSWETAFSSQLNAWRKI